MSELIGKSVGQYQIVEQIGTGGMATIFKAYQPSIDRYVAIKILPSQLAEEKNFVRRFEREAKAIAALEHLHILPVHDFGKEGNLYYMVMRYVKGGTLTNLMGKSISYDRIVQITGDIAKALDYAHERGVVHRDIKPSNILIDEHGEVLLTDFGIAKLVETSQSPQLTAAGNVLGTPAYMSPEHGQGQKVDGRSDIYSWGVVLYELLTGRLPYEAETPLAIILKHINDPLPPPRSLNPEIPEAFERVVLKAMAKDPGQRYEAAGQMSQALNKALKETEGTFVVPVRTTAEPRSMEEAKAASKGSAMGPVLIIGAVVVLLLCGLVGAGLVVSGLLTSPDEDVALATPTTNSFVDLAESNVATATPATAIESEVEHNESHGEDELAADLEKEEVDETKNGKVEIEESESSINTEDEILFEDDFSTDVNGWFVGEDSRESYYQVNQISEGKYRMSLKAKDNVVTFYRVPNISSKDFRLSIEVTLVETSAEVGDAKVYIDFRVNENWDYYRVRFRNDGTIKVYRELDGETATIYDTTPTDAIKLIPGTTNIFEVVVKNSTFIIYANGQEVAIVRDTRLSQSGNIELGLGLYEANDTLVVDFDNLLIQDAPLGEILFEESFDSDANGWATGEFDDDYTRHDITIKDGIYTLQVTAKENYVFVERTLPSLVFSDVVLTVEATPHDAGGDYCYGVAFRKDSHEHFYTFEIGNDGLYAVFLADGFQNWKTLKDWSNTNAIVAGGTNELKVVADGETLTFFVNDQQLTTIEDATFSEGKVGLMVDIHEDLAATVDFDNLVIRAVE